MKKVILAILFFGFLPQLNFAQEDIAKQILSFSDSSEYIIANSRKLIIQKVQKGDLQTIPEILFYVKSKVDLERNLPFYKWEEQMLALLNRDLESFFEASKADTVNKFAINPPSDNLGNVCYTRFMDNKQDIKKWSEALLLSNEQAMVLKIFLGQIDVYADNYAASALIHKFEKTYPNSEYIEFVKSAKSDFLTGSWEFAMGSGSIGFSGAFSEYCSSSPILFFETGGFLNRFYWSIYFNGLIGASLDQPVTLLDTDGNYYYYVQGDPLNGFNGGLKTGWLLFKKNRFRVYPYSLITGFGSTLKAEELEDGTIDFSNMFGLGAGMGFDYALLKWLGRDDSGNKTVNQQLELRCNVNYQHFFSGSKSLPGDGVYWNAGLVLRFGE